MEYLCNKNIYIQVSRGKNGSQNVIAMTLVNFTSSLENFYPFNLFSIVVINHQIVLSFL